MDKHLDADATEGIQPDSIETERVYETIFREMKDAVFLIDVDQTGDDCTFTFRRNNTSHQDLTGLTEDVMCGQTPRELLGDEQGAIVAANYRRCVEQGETIQYEESLELPAGTNHWQTKLTPITDDGKITQIVGVARDITKQKEHERMLEEQRDNLEILNKIIRHDIGNNLQFVVAYGDMLEDYVEKDGEEFLEHIMSRGWEAVDITRTAGEVTDVLLSSETDQTPINLKHILIAQIDNLRENNERALVSVEGTLPDVAVLADEMLNSVFRNLLNNAVVHNDKETPKVIVSATANDHVVQVHIADNGPGIPDEQKDQIFEGGEKGLDSDGSGIGLYLVQTLVERYGGTVWIEDNEPEGSVFVVELRCEQ